MTQAAAKVEPQGSPFWHFSLNFYRAPQVAEACIRLQDEAGVDVNLLFFLLWQASLKRQLLAGDVEKADAAIRGWRKNAVVPLREIRRALKSAPGPFDAGSAELFRTKVKGLELEAERLEQESLYAFSQSAPLGDPVASTAEAARASVTAYEKFAARDFPRGPVDLILQAFGALQR